MMEEDLVAHILASGDVSAIVQNRVSWVQRPQGSALPAIVLTLVSARRTYAMGGQSGLAESRVQVDCYGDKYGSTKLLGRAVADLLSGARTTIGDTIIEGAFLDGERDLYEDESKVFRNSQDFIIWHKQAGE